MEPEIFQRQTAPSPSRSLSSRPSKGTASLRPPAFQLRAFRHAPIQAAGLQDYSQPKAEVIPELEFKLQKQIMQQLTDKIETDKFRPPHDVYRIGTVELTKAPNGRIQPKFLLPGKALAIPARMEDGSHMIKEEAVLQSMINNNVMSTLKGAQQMDYIQQNDLVNDDWRIVVDIDFYYDRPENAIGFHKKIPLENPSS